VALVKYLPHINNGRWTPLIITLSTTFFGYEKVIDLGFWETPCTIILPRLGRVPNKSNFKITGYETRAGVKFQKMPTNKGSKFLIK